MALVDLDGTWLKANPALYTMLGYNEDELIKKTFQEITHEDDLEMDTFYVGQVLEGKIETYQITKRYYHKNGHIIWALLSTAIVKNTLGKPLYFISQIVDISETKRIEKKANDTFFLLAEYSNDIVSKHTITGEYIYVSPICKKLLGYEPEQIVAKSIFHFVHPVDSLSVENVLRKIVSTSNVLTVRYRILCQDQSYKWVESSVRSIHNEQGEIIELLSVTHDISEIVAIKSKLRQANEMSSLDELTGIGNRRAFVTSINYYWKVCMTAHTALAAILLDIDHFKRYNDTYGHVQGDVCLQQVAQALQTSSQAIGGTVARYGGEEFIMLLPHTNEATALQAGEEIRQAIESLQIPHRASRTHQYVTVSIGIALIIPTEQDSPNAFIGHADQALYAAKQKSRNTVVLAPPFHPKGDSC